jgi:hypothetical protein
MVEALDWGFLESAIGRPRVAPTLTTSKLEEWFALDDRH